MRDRKRMHFLWPLPKDTIFSLLTSTGCSSCSASRWGRCPRGRWWCRRCAASASPAACPPQLSGPADPPRPPVTSSRTSTYSTTSTLNCTINRFKLSHCSSKHPYKVFRLDTVKFRLCLSLIKRALLSFVFGPRSAKKPHALTGCPFKRCLL